jgi:hypothetical protein
VLERVAGLTYRRLGGIDEVDWHYPSLTAWGTRVLAGEA